LLKHLLLLFYASIRVDTEVSRGCDDVKNLTQWRCVRRHCVTSSMLCRHITIARCSTSWPTSVACVACMRSTDIVNRPTVSVTSSATSSCDHRGKILRMLTRLSVLMNLLWYFTFCSADDLSQEQNEIILIFL